MLTLSFETKIPATNMSICKNKNTKYLCLKIKVVKLGNVRAELKNNATIGTVANQNSQLVPGSV